MIKRLKMKFGSSLASPPLEFETSPITIFIGPNYSGKSRLINEISRQCLTGNVDTTDIILDGLLFESFELHEAQLELESLKKYKTTTQMAVPGYSQISYKGNDLNLNDISFIQSLCNPNDIQLRVSYAQNYARFRTLFLNSGNRTLLTNDQVGGDLLKPPFTSFQKLFRDNNLRHTLSQFVYQALGSYLVVDPTSLGQLRLRLSATPPPSLDVEQGLTSLSIDFHQAATHIQEASDGAKAFVGILTEVIAGDPQVLFLDEPEAFLHPSLSNLLGLQLSRLTASSGKKIFISTHSPQFLMGCIQSGTPINVVRLTYRNGFSSARLLPSLDLYKLMRNPLLRSVGVVSALFYEHVVVTEGDPDRVFYQEINERLLNKNYNLGISNCIFLNAQNKQTIPTIIAPLRNLGIPAAGIYDIDIINDKGSTSISYLNSANIPEFTQKSLSTLRSLLSAASEKTGKSLKRDGGIKLFDSSTVISANDYFDQLEAYGIFAVRGGELESWLKHLAIAGHGPSWLISMLEKMEEDPDSKTYTSPSTGDVWDFIQNIRKWLLDPRRKGIPA